MKELTQYKAAKIAGLMLLFGMASSMLSELYLRGSLFVPGNFAQSAQNIMTHERQFRIAIVFDFLTSISVLLLLWALYILLKSINKNLALLGVFIRLAEVTFFFVILTSNFIVLQLLSADDFLKVFEPDQLQAMSRLAMRTRGAAFNIGFAMLSLGSTVFNYLLFNSNYIPKALAGFGLFSSILFLICTLAIIIFPGISMIVIPFWFIPMFLYEVTLGFWFVIKGVNLSEAKS